MHDRERGQLKQHFQLISKNTKPILFIHGSADSFVPCSMVYDVYHAAKTEKELLVVEGAEHGASAAVMGEAYWDAVFRFIGRHITDKCA